MKGPVLVTRLAALGIVGAALFASGCGDGEVFFPTSSSSGTGGSGNHGGTSPQGGGGSGGTAAGSAGSTTGGAGTAGAMSGGSAGSSGSAGTMMAGGSGGSMPTGDCATPADCDAKYGVAACGGWTCNMGACEINVPGCTDSDHDGYGAGQSCQCAGLDCDDSNENITTSATASCYSGPMGTAGIGTCHTGTTVCDHGNWSICGGEVIPSGEACNNQDDDCNGIVDDNLGMFSCGIGACANTIPACVNGVASTCKPLQPASANDATCNSKDDDCDGAVDEDCAASCLYVSPGGDDMNGTGALNAPFKTIQKGIDAAAANAAGPQTVCVIAGTLCGTGLTPVTGTYTNAAGTTVTMKQGISVLGNYEGLGGTRCSFANTTTVIQPQTPEGVTFPNTVAKPTVLDGFRIDRYQAATTAGVTVDGAKGAMLSNLSILQSPPNVNTSYGVNVINGGDATITSSRIDAGSGNVESVGVRSAAARVTVQNNCPTIDANTGRCTGFCFNGNTQQPSIVGRAQGMGTTYAIELRDSPNSRVETSAICRNDADIGAAIRITGDGAGVQVRANNINAFGGAQQSYGIWMDDCNDAAPWIVDNNAIATQGDTGQTIVNAIRATGKCHPVIDSNVTIVGGAEGQAHNPTAIYCGINAAGDPSECVVLGNGSIRGSGACFPPTSIGIHCDRGGCNRIANNRLITGRGAANDSVGVWLDDSGTVVENNQIQGGCVANGGGMGTATGVRLDNAAARLENNRIFGYTASDCQCGAGSAGNPAASYGVRMFIEGGVYESDVHSNDIDAGGPPQGAMNVCQGRAVAVDLDPGGPMGQQGIFRNNIFRAGSCMTSRVSFFEAIAGADPRVLENNDFDPAGPPTALYFDENMNMLGTIAEVNALLDLTVAANISMDPQFQSYPMDVHLKGGSPCVDAGTPVGAPAFDMDGKLRDAMPDIGADEH